MELVLMSLECLHIRLRSTVVGAPHSQNLFEHHQRRETQGSDTFIILRN